MATSKLFTPRVANLRSDTFVGAPARPEVEPTFAATSGGEACNPLTFGGANGEKEMPLQKKLIVSKSRNEFDY